jgi:hypothetical protein
MSLKVNVWQNISNNIYIAFTELVSNLPCFSWQKEVLKALDEKVNRLMLSLKFPEDSKIKCEIKVNLIKKFVDFNQHERGQSRECLLDKTELFVEESLRLRCLPDTKISLKPHKLLKKIKDHVLDELNKKNKELNKFPLAIKLLDDPEIKKLAALIDSKLEQTMSVKELACLVVQITPILQNSIKKYSKEAIGADSLVEAGISLFLRLKNEGYPEAIEILRDHFKKNSGFGTVAWMSLNLYNSLYAFNLDS